jgi:predicted MFS family arabinose efflux permease
LSIDPRAIRCDTIHLFAARMIRMFAYGALSIVFVLHLGRIGLDGPAVGALLTLTLLGDAAISLWLTTQADRFGRKRTLIAGAVLMAAGGAMFLATERFELLLAAAIIGVISPGGKEIGPFLSIEQAALSQVLPDRERTRTFARYNLAGSLAAALGALAGGWATSIIARAGFGEDTAHRAVLGAYAIAGTALVFLFAQLSPAVGAPDRQGPAAPSHRFGLHRSRGVVVRLSALFGLDAFAGGFILQSVIAYWFHVRFGIDAAGLGSLFFGANLLAAFSALVAHRIAGRIGLVRTMVFTHLPSNVILILVPLMPTLPLAVALLLLRSTISQMDVPTRQSYTMAVVDPDERSSASGITTIARSLGAAAAPVAGGAFLMSGSGVPFFVAGTLKIVYDLLLFQMFRQLKPPEER